MTRSLADLVRRAERGRVAVVDRDREVTYGELDALAGGWAGALANAGVGPGDTVVLHLEKSIEAIAAIHGVLRLGAAYVPVDPASPPDRAARILSDARPRAIVLDARTSRRWPSPGPPVPTVTEPLGSGPTGDPDPEDLAYVLYTSGSTGAPKGVELTHANALAFVDWATEALDVRTADRLSSHAPLHFDLSIFDVFAAAATGAALVLVPKVISRFPVEQAAWIAATGITVWYSVPSALSLMASQGALADLDLRALRTVLFAGEVFPIRYLAALMEAVPAPDYWNLYGPTETNVCTAYRVPAPPALDDPPIPIGWPVCGDAAMVTDDGELVITGPTVARGYRGGPRFSDRTFHTGDRVTVDPSGCLRYVGRVDDQVKVRGHRVELGEVEAALVQHPAVEDGAVVAVPDELVTNRLVAFAVGAAIDVRALRRHLAQALPAAMVPDSVVVVVDLPRTSTGKVDRRALIADLLGS